MAKKESVFFCQQCGYESPKWMGQCPACKEWNSFVEESLKTVSGKVKKSSPVGATTSVISINKVEGIDKKRTSTEIAELDRVLGGGIVKGSLVLIGGDPGIGKSTILLQMCRNLANKGEKVLYISGEESAEQIKLRADRIGSFADNLLVMCETSISAIEETIEREKSAFIVIDSIQTMYSDDVNSAPGSVSQVREATNAFLRIAKGLNVSIFLVGHVTKEGAVCGPRVLEHMVDTVLYFEGDRHASYRVLRGVKNRFGSTNEIGVFEMNEAGLREVLNPSEFMIEGKPKGTSGSVIACSMEGTRPILLEVQALICYSNLGIPRRTTVGADLNRVNQLMAVLEKRGGYKMSTSDAYINIAGGIRMNEPALDLPIALAIVSSFKDKIIEDDLISFGEIGLSGEIRAISMAERRIKEAAKLGFKKCLLPKSNIKGLKIEEDIELIGIESVKDIGKFLK